MVTFSISMYLVGLILISTDKEIYYEDFAFTLSEAYQEIGCNQDPIYCTDKYNEIISVYAQQVAHQFYRFYNDSRDPVVDYLWGFSSEEKVKASDWLASNLVNTSIRLKDKYGKYPQIKKTDEAMSKLRGILPSLSLDVTSLTILSLFLTWLLWMFKKLIFRSGTDVVSGAVEAISDVA